MLKKEEYFFAVRRPYSLFFGSLIFNGFKEYKHYKSLIDKPFAITEWVLVDANFYYSTKQIKEAGKLAFESWKTPKKFEKAKKLFIEREKKLIDSTKSNLKEFSKAYESYIPALILVWACENPVSGRIKKLLLEKISKKDAENLMNALNTPLEDNFYKKEKYDLVNTKDINAHVKEYEWVFSRYGGYNPYTAEQAKKKLSKINKKEFLKKWNKEKAELRKSIKYAKELLGKDAHLIDFLQFVLYYRTQRTDIMNRAGYLFIPKLKELAKEKSLSYEQIINCTKEEMLGKLPSAKEIDNRIKNNYASVGHNGVIKYFYGKEISKLRNYMKDDVLNAKEIKGAVACKGVVKGHVKIISNSSEFSKLKKGDILVTSMTTPDYIPIMKKAAAFVTDEGGISCHAAIVSREMDKPCVIGTKIATKALKDDDIVEVDADKGVVRKIK